MRLVVFAATEREGQRRALVGNCRARLWQAMSYQRGTRPLIGGEDREPSVRATILRRHDQSGDAPRPGFARERAPVPARKSRLLTAPATSAEPPTKLRRAQATQRFVNDRGPAEDRPRSVPAASIAHRSVHRSGRSIVSADHARFTVECPRATAGLTTP